MIIQGKNLVVILSVFLFNCIAGSQSITTTKHNLSMTGAGDIKASSEPEICIFCHTPHRSSPRDPLWNRPDPGLNYTLYSSSTLQAAPGQPDGASILCLSCHDGTIALGSVLSRSTDIAFSGGVTVMPSGNTNLTTDISDDHPVSFTYNSTLAAQDAEIVDPASLSGPVQVKNGKMQCTSCHDAHNNMIGNFLVATNQYSELCLYCHQKNNWDVSSHKISVMTWDNTGNNPWFHTPYTTVAENGCENCHNPHNAGGHSFITNYFSEEANCLDCHNGNASGTNIEAELNKTYTHNVYNYTQVHDPQENALTTVQHVECVDCHNPHAARSAAASPPNASGFIQNTIGIDSEGSMITNITYQYEQCYRCHADSPAKPAGSISRQIEQNNVRLEFDLNNPSFHPVEGPGVNVNVPSLISPYTESSVIYCTECHAGDGAGSPAGPHGSIYPQILKYRYETADNTPESYQAYELCYQCHDRNVIINTDTNFGNDVHRKHIEGEDTPCSACHDPHGISGSQGNSTNNTHLINFDLSIVSPPRGGMGGNLEFVDDGNFTGRCYLECHGRNHNPRNY